jgi:RNA polymerase sigma-70 factor (ECF subfamily)
MRETDAKAGASQRGAAAAAPGGEGLRVVASDVSLGLAFATHAGALADLIVRLLGHDDYHVEQLIEAAFAQMSRSRVVPSDAAAIRRWLIRAVMGRLRWSVRRRRLQRVWPSRGRRCLAEGFFADISDRKQACVARLLYDWLDGLGARDRIAWVLRHGQGESVAVVAQLCGESLARMKRRLSYLDRQHHRSPLRTVPVAELGRAIGVVAAFWDARRARECWAFLCAVTLRGSNRKGRGPTAGAPNRIN